MRSGRVDAATTVVGVKGPTCTDLFHNRPAPTRRLKEIKAEDERSNTSADSRWTAADHRGAEL